MSFAPLPLHPVVLSYGTFDLFTDVHVRHLSKLARLGREVIVGCATDTYCAAIGQRPEMDYAQRRGLLESCRYVTRVVAQDCASQMRTDIINYNASMIAMGAEYAGLLDDLKDLTRVRYLSDRLEDAPRSLPLAVAV